MQKTNLDVSEFATAMGVSAVTVYRKLDEFSHLRIGRKILFNEDSIRDFNEKFTRRPKQSKNVELNEIR